MLVSRWGNSLGVRLPRALVDRLGLKPGDKLEVVGGHIETGQGAEGRTPASRGAGSIRMRARALRFPEGYGFDRDEAKCSMSAFIDTNVLVYAQGTGQQERGRRGRWSSTAASSACRC